MKKFVCISAFCLLLLLVPFAVKNIGNKERPLLLNVSYDVIRDFYKAYNPQFRRFYQHQYGQDFTISQSHGGAAKQTISVANGLPADVVSLTQESDIDMLVKKGLVNPQWQEALPNHATPFGSVMVFLVRKGNPKGIRDWADLAAREISVIFANPKTSANGRFAYLSLWAYAQKNFSGAKQQTSFVREVLSNVPLLEAGARSASLAFTRRGLGDVLITPENEAALAMRSSGEDKFEIIYPSYSAYTPVLVAEVEKNSAYGNVRTLARAYLLNLWSEQAQKLAAEHYFRPSNPQILAAYAERFPAVNSFKVNDVFGDWDSINRIHFTAQGSFDQLYTAVQKAKQLAPTAKEKP
ncbi:sulfate transport system substrate-binding protein [Mesocricetibacter intestinalis]|uniref:Sulfate transport system substrate-binding protein n=1 Tax=Mesocricetibacter intestinalis TaxID=1521930 RepID=A0A4R6VER0_9PAST|nr:sulfate ABC transporter substrate-binding protein [Mesocricetibacter intestinalis]TDQ58970.1 sulfate transport system substrate-binding protein [Mesocricetibacter intestinalis]